MWGILLGMKFKYSLLVTLFVLVFTPSMALATESFELLVRTACSASLVHSTTLSLSLGSYQYNLETPLFIWMVILSVPLASVFMVLYFIKATREGKIDYIDLTLRVIFFVLIIAGPINYGNSTYKPFSVEVLSILTQVQVGLPKYLTKPQLLDEGYTRPGLSIEHEIQSMQQATLDEVVRGAMLEINKSRLQLAQAERDPAFAPTATSTTQREWKKPARLPSEWSLNLLYLFNHPRMRAIDPIGTGAIWPSRSNFDIPLANDYGIRANPDIGIAEEPDLRPYVTIAELDAASGDMPAEPMTTYKLALTKFLSYDSTTSTSSISAVENEFKRTESGSSHRPSTGRSFLLRDGRITGTGATAIEDGSVTAPISNAFRSSTNRITATQLENYRKQYKLNLLFALSVSQVLAIAGDSPALKLMIKPQGTEFRLPCPVSNLSSMVAQVGHATEVLPAPADKMAVSTDVLRTLVGWVTKACMYVLCIFYPLLLKLTWVQLIMVAPALLYPPAEKAVKGLINVIITYTITPLVGVTLIIVFNGFCTGMYGWIVDSTVSQSLSPLDILLYPIRQAIGSNIFLPFFVMIIVGDIFFTIKAQSFATKLLSGASVAGAAVGGAMMAAAAGVATLAGMPGVTAAKGVVSAGLDKLSAGASAIGQTAVGAGSEILDKVANKLGAKGGASSTTPNPGQEDKKTGSVDRSSSKQTQLQEAAESEQAQRNSSTNNGAIPISGSDPSASGSAGPANAGSTGSTVSAGSTPSARSTAPNTELAELDRRLARGHGPQSSEGNGVMAAATQSNASPGSNAAPSSNASDDVGSKDGSNVTPTSGTGDDPSTPNLNKFKDAGRSAVGAVKNTGVALKRAYTDPRGASRRAASGAVRAVRAKITPHNLKAFTKGAASLFIPVYPHQRSDAAKTLKAASKLALYATGMSSSSPVEAMTELYQRSTTNEKLDTISNSLLTSNKQEPIEKNKSDEAIEPKQTAKV